MKMFEQFNDHDPFGEERADPLAGMKLIVVIYDDMTYVHMIPMAIYDEIIEKFLSLERMYEKKCKRDEEADRYYTIITESETLNADGFYVY